MKPFSWLFIPTALLWASQLPLAENIIPGLSIDPAVNILDGKLAAESVTVNTRSGTKQVPVTDNFFTSLVTSFGMILLSELGDKTFLVAAIMAMRHSRLTVFLATSAALTLMTVISVAAGRIIPALVSQSVTKWIAALLFLIFGVMMVKEGVEMSPEHFNEEYEEVAHELEDGRTPSAANLAEMEAQSPNLSNNGNANVSADQILSSKLAHIFNGAFSPIAIQIFSMVFVAEWGDRSQLATIVLAAAQNPVGVAIGASSGHAMCSLIAVLLGRALSSILSIKTVTVSGGLLFILFAFVTLI